MIIRKLFKFEAAHRVRRCTSGKCRDNIHGHSYKVEVFITSDRLDDGCMVMDFGRLSRIREFIGCFDHSYCLWNREDGKVKEAVRALTPRVVGLPLSPSSEGLALTFFRVIDDILSHTVPVNGEGHVRLHSVRVHETETGYAEAFREDLALAAFDAGDICFSDAVRQEWKDGTWWEDLLAACRN